MLKAESPKYEEDCINKEYIHWISSSPAGSRGLGSHRMSLKVSLGGILCLGAAGVGQFTMPSQAHPLATGSPESSLASVPRPSVSPSGCLTYPHPPFHPPSLDAKSRTSAPETECSECPRLPTMSQLSSWMSGRDKLNGPQKGIWGIMCKAGD